ncbi:MAG TPA: hypothetical protein VGM75_14540 [Pseudonocardiaceae bacterium]
MDPAGDFDDFPDDADRESLDDVADRFFAAWQEFDDAEAKKKTRQAQWRVSKLVGVAGMLAGLVAVPVILSQQPAVSSQPAPAVTLDQPVDHGDSADLSWHGQPGLRYAVVVAGASRATRVIFVGGQQTSVLIDPGRPYCFLIQATDGRGVYATPPRAIRGAVCRH